MHGLLLWAMRQVSLEYDINIVVNGPFLVPNLHQEWPFVAMLISTLEEGFVLCPQCWIFTFKVLPANLIYRTRIQSAIPPSDDEL